MRFCCPRSPLPLDVSCLTGPLIHLTSRVLLYEGCAHVEEFDAWVGGIR